MSSETGALSLDLPDTYYRRLFALIPARSLESVLTPLTEVWCEATGADAAYLAIYDRRLHQLTGCVHRVAENQTEFFLAEAITVDPQLAASEQARSAFAQGRSFSTISLAPFEYFSIPTMSDDLAGVLLYSTRQLTEQRSRIDALIEISRRLLAQSRVVSTSCHEDTHPSPSAPPVHSKRKFVLPSRDKLEAMAEFAAGAGHEINNPIATIVGRVQMLLKGETDPQRRQALATIGGQAYRVRDMIGDAMLFGRPPQPQPVLLNVLSTTEEVLASLEEMIAASGVQVSLQIPEQHTIWADESQWKVVLSNLLLNCLNVLEVGGEIQLSTKEVSGESGRLLYLRVIDNGPGLTAEEQEHLFDPFYSARQAGRGLGFGLSKCWRIISMHSGTIEAELNDDRGVTMHVYWPVEKLEAGENK